MHCGSWILDHASWILDCQDPTTARSTKTHTHTHMRPLTTLCGCVLPMQLMEKLFGVLRVGGLGVQEVALSAMASTIAASGKSFEAFVGELQ